MREVHIHNLLGKCHISVSVCMSRTEGGVGSGKSRISGYKLSLWEACGRMGLKGHSDIFSVLICQRESLVSWDEQ